MKILLRKFFTFLLAISGVFCFAYFFLGKPKFEPTEHKTHKADLSLSSQEFDKLKSKAIVLENYAVAHGYNRDLFFLVDMSISSGKNRFFVYNTINDSIILEGLVAHGSCDNGFQINATFSNAKECGCSSVGKYMIGFSYTGRFGLAYKLYGLDTSNSNAFARNIVLHAYDCVPEQETDPVPICNSRGCPMISTGFLQQVKPYITNSKKSLLLWIFK